MRREGDLVRIHYLRPPDDEQVFTQELLLDSDQVKITLARGVELQPPLRIQGRVVLETGSDAVWFTFPGAWWDVGRFHRADGTFTGFYANVLTPPTFENAGRTWRTTDLFLDVFSTPEGEVLLLDRDQLDEAEARGWVEEKTVRRARRAAAEILALAEAGRWPPRIVRTWTRERALARSAQSSSSSSSTR